MAYMQTMNPQMVLDEYGELADLGEGSQEPMKDRARLIESVVNNPRDVRFTDACKIAEWLGFTRTKGKGSHTNFSMTGELCGLNFQNHKGKIPTYQARQLVKMIEKYKERIQ